jgi:hypothetical protein
VLDRPVGFTVLRGKRPALRIDTIDALHKQVAISVPEPTPRRRAKRRRKRS